MSDSNIPFYRCPWGYNVVLPQNVRVSAFCCTKTTCFEEWFLHIVSCKAQPRGMVSLLHDQFSKHFGRSTNSSQISSAFFGFNSSNDRISVIEDSGKSNSPDSRFVNIEKESSEPNISQVDVHQEIFPASRVSVVHHKNVVLGKSPAKTKAISKPKPVAKTVKAVTGQPKLSRSSKSNKRKKKSGDGSGEVQVLKKSKKTDTCEASMVSISSFDFFKKCTHK